TYGLINTRFWKSRVCHTNLIKYGTNAAARTHGIWAASGNGKVWAVGSYGMGANPYAGNDQIMYSPDGGTTWSIQPTETSAYQASLYSISMINTSTGYAAGSTGIILKTTNGGNNWRTLTSPTSNDLNKIDFINSSTGWVFGISGTIYKTTNGGGNWLQETATGVSGTISGAYMVDANTGWLIGPGGIISKTTDSGYNWSPQTANAGTHTLYSIKMLNANTGYLCGYTVVRKTINGGNTWDSVLTPSAISTYFSLDFIDVNNGIIAGYGGQITRTTDGGQSWTVYYIGTDNAIYATYMTSPDTIFAAGDEASIYKFPMGMTKVLEWNNQVPTKYVLYQNYPNPFNPSTTIRFSLPKSGNISLRVYDITGREVKTLLNNEQLNRGTINLTFDGSNLASGVYFYSLSVDGNMIGSKKMVLLK
ncbi:MAG: YCF48-related protein, partial [Ignavibacteria bacterium]